VAAVASPAAQTWSRPAAHRRDSGGWTVAITRRYACRSRLRRPRAPGR